MPTLGIIGGGQLGSMLASAAKKLDIKTIIFCDDKNAPGQKFSDKFICADYSDDKAINQFVDISDIITFEFENIPYETLDKINKVKPVIPKPFINQVIQHRLKEKNFINKLNIKTTEYILIKNKLSKRLLPIEVISGKINEGERIMLEKIDFGKVMIDKDYPYALINFKANNFDFNTIYNINSATVRIIKPNWLNLS